MFCCGYFSSCSYCRRIGAKTKNFHTGDKLFSHQLGKFPSMPGWAACLVDPKEILQSRSLLVLGIRHLFCHPKVASLCRVFSPILQQEGNISTQETKIEKCPQQTKEKIGAKHFYTCLVFRVTFLYWCGNGSLLLGQCVVHFYLTFVSHAWTFFVVRWRENICIKSSFFRSGTCCVLSLHLTKIRNNQKIK